MSLKDDLTSVKNEFNAEEQMIEGYIRSERFFKRYKKVFIGVGLAFLLGALGYVGMTIYNDHNKKIANEAYVILLKDPQNKKAREDLEHANTKLYHAFIFAEAMSKNDLKTLTHLATLNEPIISDIASYQSAILSGNVVAIKQYAMKQGAIFKEFSILVEAKSLLDSGKNEKAREILGKIPYESSLKEIALMMEHYTLKGTK